MSAKKRLGLQESKKMLTYKQIQKIPYLESSISREYSELDTPFGLIQLCDCSLLYTVYGENLPLVYDPDEVADLLSQKDYIGAVIVLEKAIEKYPKAPLLYQDLALCYEQLKEREKLVDIVQQNYQLNNGLPMVDIFHELAIIDRERNLKDLAFFMPTFSIHESYPRQKHFHPDEVRDFYYLLGICAFYQNNVPLLEQCFDIVKKVGYRSQKYSLLQARLTQKRHPFRTTFLFIFLILLALGAVIGLFWIIYKLGTWVF
jgi:tetratricopeptide (TPR) repeat protein